MSGFPPLWENEDLRDEWLQCLRYLKDDELLTYKDWLEAEKDIAFETLQDNLKEDPNIYGVVGSYLDYVKSVNAELFFLRQQS